MQWGSHLAHVFSTGAELRDLLVPYFKAGLENNERCLWVTGSKFRSRGHLYATCYTEGFSHFVTSMTCSGCFRLERLAGRGLHPLESAALSRRTR
jgi:hypothetical protein